MTPSCAAVLFSKLNGVMFPGGGADLSEGSQFIAAASLAFNTSVAAAGIGETFPIWGTCLVSIHWHSRAEDDFHLIYAQGFETVCTVASRNFSLLQEVDAENISLPLTWSADPTTSRFVIVNPQTSRRIRVHVHRVLCAIDLLREHGQDVRRAVICRLVHAEQSRQAVARKLVD